jgi:hypothetical protein
MIQSEDHSENNTTHEVMSIMPEILKSPLF